MLAAFGDDAVLQGEESVIDARHLLCSHDAAIQRSAAVEDIADDLIFRTLGKAGGVGCKRAGDKGEKYAGDTHTHQGTACAGWLAALENGYSDIATEIQQHGGSGL